jgi:hypothetical protein
MALTVTDERKEMAMHPILSNRDTLVAFILSVGLILASILAFSSTLQAPGAGLAAIEPSTLGGGSGAADSSTVAYLADSETAAPSDVSTIRTATP